MTKTITIKLTEDQARLLKVTLSENLNDDPIDEAYKSFCRRILTKINAELVR